jgi:hypothetical protein
MDDGLRVSTYVGRDHSYLLIGTFDEKMADRRNLAGRHGTSCGMRCQGVHKSGKPGKPGNLREFDVVWKIRELSGNFVIAQRKN